MKNDIEQFISNTETLTSEELNDIVSFTENFCDDLIPGGNIQHMETAIGMSKSSNQLVHEIFQSGRYDELRNNPCLIDFIKSLRNTAKSTRNLKIIIIFDKLFNEIPTAS